VGDNYAGHLVGSGPYTPDTYMPQQSVVLVRNPNWDPTTDPLRKAWVDRIQVKLNISLSSMQQQIEHEEADLALDSHVPETQLAALRADPERARRLSVNPSGTLRFLVLGTNPKAGAIADVRVRRAVNYAIDKVAYRDAIAGRWAASGELASTSCHPMRSATAATTSTRPRAAGATQPRPGPCSPRPAIPTG
jgi:ABC-type transport system substrate-binding protein